MLCPLLNLLNIEAPSFSLKERSVVLHQCESETQKFGTKQVDKG